MVSEPASVCMEHSVMLVLCVTAQNSFSAYERAVYAALSGNLKQVGSCLCVCVCLA